MFTIASKLPVGSLLRQRISTTSLQASPGNRDFVPLLNAQQQKAYMKALNSLFHNQLACANCIELGCRLSSLIFQLFSILADLSMLICQISRVFLIYFTRSLLFLLGERFTKILLQVTYSSFRSLPQFLSTCYMPNKH